jgi:hypothetical protein
LYYLPKLDKRQRHVIHFGNNQSDEQRKCPVDQNSKTWLNAIKLKTGVSTHGRATIRLTQRELGANLSHVHEKRKKCCMHETEANRHD